MPIQHVSKLYKNTEKNGSLLGSLIDHVALEVTGIKWINDTIINTGLMIWVKTWLKLKLSVL